MKLVLQAKQRLLALTKKVEAAPKGSDFQVKINYDDPTGKGMASTNVMVRDCRDADHARKIFKEQHAHHFKNAKIEKVTKLKGNGQSED